MTSLDGAFPRVTVQRGGIRYPVPGTPEYDRLTRERQIEDAMRAFITRHVGEILDAQEQVLNNAAVEALRYGWDIHVYRRTFVPSRSHGQRFIGIELREQDRPRLIPTIHEHLNHDATFDWDADW